MNLLYIFPTPDTATCILRHDIGWTLTAIPAVHPSGRPGQVFDIPASTPQDNGCSLEISAQGYHPLTVRSVLHIGPETYLRTDDFHLTKATVTLPRLVANGQFLEKPDA